MASDKAYLDFVLGQCDGLSARAMMGEYVLYYNGQVIGGIYDNRFLIKLTPTAVALIPDAEYQLPYDGAKKLILVDNIDDKEFLKLLFEGVSNEIASAKSKKLTKKQRYCL